MLKEIYKELQAIRVRLDDLERLYLNRIYTPVQIPESKLLDLPDSIRKTYLAVVSRQKDSTATDIAAATGRVRPVESLYLNQLVRMGWLTKHSNSRHRVFRVIAQ